MEKMGKKLDALFGRSFKASKLKALLNLAISRIAVFKNQRQARSKQALSDVLQLLQQSHHQRALLRVTYIHTYTQITLTFLPYIPFPSVYICLLVS